MEHSGSLVKMTHQLLLLNLKQQLNLQQLLQEQQQQPVQQVWIFLFCTIQDS